MASQNTSSFLETMARLATGSLQGKSQAIQDYGQHQAAKQKLLLGQMKLQQDAENNARDRAFQYAGELQKSLTPDNMKYLQDNGLLDQFHREIGNALSVAAGQTPYHQWAPQFAFSDQPSASPSPGTPAGTGAAATTTPLTAPPVTPNAAPPANAPPPSVTGMNPKLSDIMPAPGGTAPSPFAAPSGAGVSLGPAAPPLPAAIMPSPPVMGPPVPPVPPPARTAFSLTPAQTIADRAETESEAKGAADRVNDAAGRVLAKKKYNLDVAVAQLDHDMETAKFRQGVGQEADKSATAKWEKLLDMAVQYQKAGGTTDNTAKAIKSLLSVPNALGGRMPNATAIREYFQRSGVPDAVINQILADPAIAASGIDATQKVQQDMTGGAGISSRGSAPVGPGGVPVLPPADGAGAPLDPGATAALKARGALLGRGAPTTNRGAAAPPRLAGSPHAIAAMGQMQPEAQTAAQSGFKALTDAGIQFTVNSTERSSQEQKNLYKKRGSNPNPVAPPGMSMHERGIAMDLSNTSGSQADMAQILAPFGWKWAGGGDPVHFTYTGTGAARGGGPLASRGGSAPPKTAAVPPTVAPGGAASPMKTPDLNETTSAVGVKTPATAAPITNPYPNGTLGSLVYDSLVKGQQTPEGLIDMYAGQPEKQKVVQEVAERYKGMQAGNLMGGLPTPSLEGAEVPTQAGVRSLGNLMYNEPEVGKPDITTEPIESNPLSARQEITQRKGEPSRQTGPAAAGAASPPVAPGKSAGPAAKPATQSARPAAPAAKPGAPARPRTGPNLLAVPPPPQPGPNLMSAPPGPTGTPTRVSTGRGPVLPGESKVLNDRVTRLLAADAQSGRLHPDQSGTRLAQQIGRIVGRQINYDRKTGAIVDPSTGTTFHRGQPHDNAGTAVTPNWFTTPGPSLLGTGPKQEKPQTVATGPGPKVELSPQERRGIQDSVRAYSDSPYRKGIDRWLQQQGLDTLPNRLFYYGWVHRDFVPGMIRKGVPADELAQNLPHYLRANMSNWRSAAGRIIAGPEKQMSATGEPEPLTPRREETPASPDLVPAPSMEPGPPAFRPRRQ